jgi:hypothetical protein
VNGVLVYTHANGRDIEEAVDSARQRVELGADVHLLHDVHHRLTPIEAGRLGKALVIPTELNRALLATPRGDELLLRTPMRRFGEASELIGAALYLASDACSFTTGQILAVDGGFLASGVNQ